MGNDFKFGICEWLLPVPGPISFKLAAELGYDGVQILDWGGRENNYPLNLGWVQDEFRKCLDETGIVIQTLQLQSLVRSGGMTALEVAEDLAAKGSKVTVIVRSDKLGKGVDPDNVVKPLEGIAEHGGEVKKLHTPYGVNEEGVMVRGTKDGVESVIPADIIVLSLGNTPNSEICAELVGTAEYIIPVGDADHPGRVSNAVRTGFEQAYVLEAE